MAGMCTSWATGLTYAEDAGVKNKADLKENDTGERMNVGAVQTQVGKAAQGKCASTRSSSNDEIKNNNDGVDVVKKNAEGVDVVKKVPSKTHKDIQQTQSSEAGQGDKASEHVHVRTNQDDNSSLSGRHSACDDNAFYVSSSIHTISQRDSDMNSSSARRKDSDMDSRHQDQPACPPPANLTRPPSHTDSGSSFPEKRAPCAVWRVFRAIFKKISKALGGSSQMDEETAELVKEIEILSKLRHPNITM
jgi:hypothetical protein